MGTVVAVVAAVAIAVVAPWAGAALAGAIWGTGASAVAIGLMTAAVGLTLSIGAALAFRALGIGAPKAQNAVGPPQVFRQTITDSFIVYGKRRVGGLLVFYHPRTVGDDHYRYFVIAVAGHRCQGVVSWMLNDEIVTVNGSNMVTSGKYANAAWLWFVRGTNTDAANATFVSECGGKWTSAHKGLGVAKIYAKFKMTDDVVQAGMPNITAIIEGRDEVYNPGGAVGYTRNWARIFYDWMQIPREDGGFGAYADEIPDTTWISAQANVCDETVNSNPRYQVDAVITTGAAPSEVRDVFVVNAAGSYTYTGGKHLARPGYWVAPSATLAEDDLAGPIQVSPFMTADAAANEVQGTYISPDDGYQGMPLTTWSVAAADVKQLHVDLAFVTVKDQGDRILAIMGKRAQCEKTVVWTMNIEGLKIRALDTVQLDAERYGLNNYAFQVMNWGLSYEQGGPVITVQLREENEDIYDDGSPTAPPTVPDIAQPTPILTIGQIQAILKDTYPTGLTVSASDAGSNATVTLSGFTLKYPSPYGDKTISGPTNLTGRAYSTEYFPYIDVSGPGDASPTFGTSTTLANALNSITNPRRIYLQQSITTPASGGGGTGGTGTGGGFGGGGGTYIP